MNEQHRYPRITIDKLPFSQLPNIFLYASTKIALVSVYNAMPDMPHSVTFIETSKTINDGSIKNLEINEEKCFE